jgi:hypothetical protein
MNKCFFITTFILSNLLATLTEGNSINIESIKIMPSAQTQPISDSYAIKRIYDILNDSEGCAIDLDFITTRNYSQNTISKVGIESNTLISTNKEFFLAIVAQNVKNIKLFQVCILYNPEQLKYISAYENTPSSFADPINNFLKKEGGTTLWMNPPKPNGKIILSSTIVGLSNEKDAPDGSGIIAFIAFELLTQKKDIDISLSEVIFMDVNNKEVKVDKLMNAIINPSIIQPVANISGIPTGESIAKDLTITVSGVSIVSYKYQLDSDPYSEEYSIDKPIVLLNLPVGLHTISVIGKSSEGTWQAEETAVSESWVITQTSTITPSAGCAIDLNFLSSRNYIQNSTSNIDIESSAHIELNHEFFIAVVAQNVKDLKVFQASLLYNPEELQYISSHENYTTPSDTIHNFLKNEGGTTLWLDPQNTPGKLVLCSAIAGLSGKKEAPDGSGIIAFVKFKLLSEKKNMNITLSDVHFADINNNEIQVVNLINAVINPGEFQLIGIPSEATTDRDITITVSGTSLVSYKYKYDQFLYSDEFSIEKQILLKDLTVGIHTIIVQAKNSEGVWQSLSESWSITNDISIPKGLFLSETSSQKIKIEWDQMGTDYTYNVYKSDTENGFYIKCDPYGLKKSEFIDTEIKGDIQYWYRITAVNSVGKESLFSEAISVTTEYIESDIQLSSVHSYTMQYPGLSAKYYLKVKAIGQYTDEVRLSVSYLHESIQHNFNREIIKPPDLVTLTLEIPDNISENRYPFFVNATGKNRDDKIQLFLDVKDPTATNSAISAYLNRKQMFLNQSVEIYGSILPKTMNTSLTIYIQHESEDTQMPIKILTDHYNNNYQYNYIPKKTGLYTIFSSWSGDDEYRPAQSPPIELTVLRGKSRITCQTPDTDISLDSTVQITGKLIAPEIGNVYIVLKIVNPDGNLELIENRIFTESDGSFNYYVKLDKEGIWEVSGCWKGNEQYQGVVSSPLRLYPGIQTGKALIVAGGGILNNSLWKTTQYLTKKFYRILIDRYYPQEMIHYISPDTNHIESDIIINDETPTVSDVQDYIEFLYQNISTPEVNSKKPLLIYMADHGGPKKFIINKSSEVLKAQDLDLWLDDLQAHTSCTVYIIIEACYSGTFVENLYPDPGQKRVIITSTGNHVAIYANDGRTSFSQNLFNELNSGYSLYNSFHTAVDKIRSLYLFKNQFPQICDGSNGELAKTSYIGVPFEEGDLLPEFIDHTPDQIITAGSKELFAEIFDVEGIAQVWVSILPPNFYVPEFSQAYDTPIIDLPKISLIHIGNVRYECTYPDFTFNGIYRVTFYCEDLGGNVVSKEILLDVIDGQRLIPGDLDQNGKLTLCDAILSLQSIAGMDVTVSASARFLCNRKLGLCEVIRILQETVK